MMADMEAAHWWFRGRRDLLKTALLRTLSDHRPLRILDAGCGSAANLSLLSSYGSVVGLEPDEFAAKVAGWRYPGAICRGRLPSDVPFRAATFDLIVALDVLEHLDDDRLALEVLRSLLRSGGVLLLTVPAFAFLWSDHDRSHHHRRRYRRGALVEVLHAVHFSVEYSSYFNTWLFPLIAAIRTSKSLLGLHSPYGDLHMPSPIVNAVLYRLFRSERQVLSRSRLPLGVSIIAIARKACEARASLAHVATQQSNRT